MRCSMLAVLAIGVALLGACTGVAEGPVDSTTTPETTDEPASTSEPEPEPEESSVNLPFVASELRNLHTAMTSLTSEYILYSRDDSWVHEFHAPSYQEAGCYWDWTMPASNIFEAREHVNNAYWLTNKSRLPGEATKRDVYTGEVLQEVNEAKTLLEQQVSYSYSHQDAEAEWILENPISSRIGSGLMTQAKKEIIIENISDVYIDYREALLKVITRLELVQSRLPQDDVIFSLQ